MKGKKDQSMVMNCFKWDVSHNVVAFLPYLVCCLTFDFVGVAVCPLQEQSQDSNNEAGLLVMGEGLPHSIALWQSSYATAPSPEHAPEAFAWQDCSPQICPPMEVPAYGSIQRKTKLSEKNIRRGNSSFHLVYSM